MSRMSNPVIASRKIPAFVVSNGISCAKLRDMMRTERDKNLPQCFGIQCQSYDTPDGRGRSMSIGNGTTVMISIKQLVNLEQGVYISGTIRTTNMYSQRGSYYGGVRSGAQNTKGVDFLHSGVEIEMIHYGAAAKGVVLSLHDPVSGDTFFPYLPDKIIPQDKLKRCLQKVLSTLQDHASKAPPPPILILPAPLTERGALLQCYNIQ